MAFGPLCRTLVQWRPPQPTDVTEPGDAVDAFRDPGELREAALSGVRWTTLARIAAEIVSFGSIVTLAHLITPAEFGRAAIALSVIALASVLTGQGFAARLVQLRSIQRAHVETATFVSLASGGAFTLAGFLLAPLAADAFFDARTAELIRLTSPAFLIMAVGTVPQSLLQRRLEFRVLAMIELAALVLTAGSSVLLATAGGLDAEALVLGSLIGTAASSSFLLWVERGSIPRWHGSAAHELATYGIPASLASILYVTTRNIDYVILGARLDPGSVGIYWRAYQLGVEYQGKITGIMLRIAFPLFSRSRDLEHMRMLRMRIVRLHAVVLMPLLALLIVLAPPLVPWLFGSNWEPAVLPTQILAVAGMATAITTGIGPLLLAADKPRVLLAWDAGFVIFYAGVVFALAPFGVTVVCWGVAAFLVLCAPVAQLLVRHVAQIPLRQLWLDVAPAAASCVPVLVTALLLRDVLTRSGASAPVVVGLTTLCGMTIYLAALRLISPGGSADLVMVARQIVPKVGGGAKP